MSFAFMRALTAGPRRFLPLAFGGSIVTTSEGEKKSSMEITGVCTAHANLPTVFVSLPHERSSGRGLDFNCNASHSQRAD